jgi:integrase
MELSEIQRRMLGALVRKSNDEAYQEQGRIDRWMDAGCPPVEEWLNAAEPEQPAEPAPVRAHERLAVTKREAGELLGGKSEDWIEKHVLPRVQTIKSSRSVLIPAAELQRWVHEDSAFIASTIRSRALKAWKAAELEPIGLHSCRRTCASFLIESGANAKALSVVMGHASIEISFNLHGHLMPGAEQEVGKMLDGYLRGNGMVTANT